jgi:glycosyltransferase involved in cell wall biosynthesis
MYCGSCLHDNTQAAGLMDQGHEVALIPTYTPLRTDERDVTNEPIFYGAINVYLQQKATFFRRAPALLGQLLDRPGLLRWVSRFAASTDARDLGALTLSILQGEEGRQQKELDRLLGFLETYRPDLVQLTNAMFLGIGAAIREQLGVPVVSGLTGEDLFLDELPPPYREQVEAEMRRRAQQVDGFIATSHYYAAVMRDFLDVASDRMHVVPLGIHLNDFAAPTPRTGESLTIGYLARICPEKGLHHLIEAFRLLRQRPGSEHLRLKIAGYLGARDRSYYERLQARVADWGLTDAVDFLGEVDRAQKLAFLDAIDILSVPTVYKEPKGLFVLEAWAAGVPVVEPRHGAFPELIEASGGGLLVEPESPEDLVRGLEQLLEDDDQRLARGRRGRAAVESEFNTGVMTDRTETVYRRIVGDDTAPSKGKSEA